MLAGIDRSHRDPGARFGITCSLDDNINRQFGHDRRISERNSFPALQPLLRRPECIRNNDVFFRITGSDKHCRRTLGVQVADDRYVQPRRAARLTDKGSTELTRTDQTGRNRPLAKGAENRIVIHKSTIPLQVLQSIPQQRGNQRCGSAVVSLNRAPIRARSKIPEQTACRHINIFT